jgi:hypothetical protein
MQDQELRKKAAELKNNLSRLMDKRSNFEVHWQEVADYMLPRKADITLERPRGDKRHTLIFDGTAIHSLELLASSLHGMLTSSVNRWFGLRFKETGINQNDEAREWLEDVTDKMYLAFSRSNFQQEVFETYFDLIAFGTSCLQIEEDKDDIIRFSSKHIKEIYISEDAKGMVNCIYRRFKMSAKATVEKFGLENLSSKVQNTFKKSQFEDIDLCHVVKPRDMYNPRKEDKQNMPFVSCYFEYDNGHIISEGGFREFPYVVPRYLKASNEIYGRSPGMNALADVKVLNKMVEVGMKAAQKQVDPPLLVPDDSMLMPIRMSPGSINYYRAGTRDRIETLNIGANNPLGLSMEDQRRQAISQIFHVDQLLITENRNMTATEVVQRNQEKMRILGPVLGRLQSELLQPMIIRIFNIMLRNDLFLPAPEILLNQEVDVEYVSPMALAQRGEELNSIVKGLELFGNVSQLAPQTLDYIDPPGLIKNLIKILGLPATMIRSDEEVKQIAEEKAEANQQQAEMQQQMAESEMARNVAPAVQAVSNAEREQQ